VAQIPGPNSDWLPLAATQYIVGAASTALTIPNPATQTPPVKNSGNMVIAAFLIPQGAAYWMRGDGTAAVATVTGGLKINIGDYRIVYVIQDGAGGALQVEYFLYRNQPVGP
jgi:hypothetical protein